jgi:hypothetical protein
MIEIQQIDGIGTIAAISILPSMPMSVTPIVHITPQNAREGNGVAMRNVWASVSTTVLSCIHRR